MVKESPESMMPGRVYPNTTVSDEKDENPRYVSYLDALENGWIRRIAEVFVINLENQEVLLQLRSGNVHVSPNSWAASVGEGVDEGEDYEDAAKRGLGEELSLPPTRLYEINKIYFNSRKNTGIYSPIFRSWSTVFGTIYDGSEIEIEKEEVDEVRWFSIKEIDQLLDADTTMFSMRFPHTWTKIRCQLAGIMQHGLPES